MAQTDLLINLKTFLSTCSEEDLVWVLHIFNRFEDSRNAANMDIDMLNQTHHLKDIKKLVIERYDQLGNREIDDFLTVLEDFKNHKIYHHFDLIKFKNNERFLNFADEILLREINDRVIPMIHNKYYRVLYMIYIYNDICSNRLLSSIEFDFSAIFSKMNQHFKNENGSEFYIWAKAYMDQNPNFHSDLYQPTQESEFKIAVNSIFDLLYHHSELEYEALKKKLSNAWYQKTYRKAGHTKKPHHYYLAERTKKALEDLAEKFGLTEENTLNRIINKTFIEEFPKKY